MASEIRLILKDVKGVKNVVKVDVNRHFIILSYDEAVTSSDKIAEALSEGGFPTEGDPEFLR